MRRRADQLSRIQLFLNKHSRIPGKNEFEFPGNRERKYTGNPGRPENGPPGMDSLLLAYSGCTPSEIDFAAVTRRACKRLR